MKNRILLLPIAVALAALVGACGAGSSTPSSSAPQTTAANSSTAKGSTINVGAGEFYFHADTKTTPAGKVTFVVTNEGQVAHEMVVIKTNTKAANLPFANGEASEDGAVGEIGEDDLGIGATATLTLHLEPGHYVLLCNLPGHFKGGMYTDFNVT